MYFALQWTSRKINHAPVNLITGNLEVQIISSLHLNRAPLLFFQTAFSVFNLAILEDENGTIPLILRQCRGQLSKLLNEQSNTIFRTQQTVATPKYCSGSNLAEETGT